MQVRQKECDTCGGNGELLDSSKDFCPVCGQPSVEYRRMVEQEALDQLYIP